MSSEVTAELIEDLFGKHSDSVRFTNFCNSVVIAQSSASAPTIQILSEKPGADGGRDGEWTIPADGSTDFKSPFGSPGWNVFQYKARSIVGDGRQAAFSKPDAQPVAGPELVRTSKGLVPGRATIHALISCQASSRPARKHFSPT
jgi:hypothetical protein